MSSISDPLLSLSSMSLSKNDFDFDHKGKASSCLSLGSISSQNNSKSKIINVKNFSEDGSNEITESLPHLRFKTSLEKDNDADNQSENMDILDIIPKKKKNKRQEKDDDENMKEESLSCDRDNEMALSSHIKNNEKLNLNIMKSSIENDPDIIHDTTSSFFIVLEDADLWKKFNSVVNEMIITKSGRCLFPILRFQPINLEPKVQYSFAIDILQASPYKYKYREKKWISGGIKFFAPPTQKKEYYHPDSPQSGTFYIILYI